MTAYLGQVNNIDSTAILATAGSIAGVEGEHASVFRFLNGASISPAAFDQPRTSAEVLAIADDFITQAPTLPFP